MVLTLKLMMLFCLLLIICLTIACRKADENLKLVFIIADAVVALLFFWAGAILWMII